MINNIINIDELNKKIEKEKKELIKKMKLFLKLKGISQTQLADEINEDIKSVNQIVNLKKFNTKVAVKIMLFFKMEYDFCVFLFNKVGIGLSNFNVEERKYRYLLKISEKVDLEMIKKL